MIDPSVICTLLFIHDPREVTFLLGSCILIIDLIVGVGWSCDWSESNTALVTTEPKLTVLPISPFHATHRSIVTAQWSNKVVKHGKEVMVSEGRIPHNLQLRYVTNL